MKSSKWLIRGVATVTLALLVVGVCAVLMTPRELRGSADIYDTITLQLQDSRFYDVRIPKDAVLKATDGGTVYTYDLLTVGVQDQEPPGPCKVKVDGRWVFATSKDNYLKATMAGFGKNKSYAGSYHIDNIQWTDKIPAVVMDIDTVMLKGLKAGHSYALGGEDFINAQRAYGTFDSAVDRALTKMSTLYRQPLDYGYKTDNSMWVTSGKYTVCVSSINYNTCLIVSACGDTGRQYAAKLMEVVK